MRLRDRLSVALTGQPYLTERRASHEFGAPIAVRAGLDVAGLSDAELMGMPAPRDLQVRAARVGVR